MMGRDVSPAAELGHEAPSGLQGPPDGFDGRFRRQHPVQHGVREHRVELGAVRQVAYVGHLEPQPRVVAAGRVDHLLAVVDADHVRARFGDAGGELSGAASDVQHALARTRVQQLDEVMAVPPHEAAVALVPLRVPGVVRHGLFGRGRRGRSGR